MLTHILLTPLASLLLARAGLGRGVAISLVVLLVGMVVRSLDGLPGALAGTLYGAMTQNIFAGPIAEKLGLLSKEEAFSKEIILQGVLSIQAGNNPRVVEMQLVSFLSVKAQAHAMKAAA